MSAFEFVNSNSCSNCGNNNNNGISGTSGNSVKDECIIALKVYDFCRIQECLTCSVLGPARAAGDSTCTYQTFESGEIIKPPSNAAAVSINNLTVKRVVVVNKRVNPFKPGYWDIDLKFVFVYTLVFRNVNGEEICNIQAQSIYNTQLTLFGSITTETLISTDLFNDEGGSANLQADPFVLVESKAVPLTAELRYSDAQCCCDDDVAEAIDVQVTIGLFAIIKLFRLVNLVVESKGFCVPNECEQTSALNACEFFDSLDFPLDIFAPPQKKEFLAGVSANIPANNSNNSSNSSNNCGCGCCCN